MKFQLAYRDCYDMPHIGRRAGEDYYCNFEKGIILSVAWENGRWTRNRHLIAYTSDYWLVDPFWFNDTIHPTKDLRQDAFLISSPDDFENLIANHCEGLDYIDLDISGEPPYAYRGQSVARGWKNS